MIKMIALKCPECGAKLQIEEGHKECFVKEKYFWMTRVLRLLVDEARIKVSFKLIRLKELEIKQKELDFIVNREWHLL